MQMFQLVRNHVTAMPHAKALIQASQPQSVIAVAVRSKPGGSGRVQNGRVSVERVILLMKSALAWFNMYNKSTLKENGDVTIGNNSCLGDGSCLWFYGNVKASIGNSSCNAYYSCYDFYGEWVCIPQMKSRFDSSTSSDFITDYLSKIMQLLQLAVNHVRVAGRVTISNHIPQPQLARAVVLRMIHALIFIVSVLWLIFEVNFHLCVLHHALLISYRKHQCYN